MKCADCNHFVLDIYAGCSYCKAMRVINKMTRQQLLDNIADLFGFGESDFEAMEDIGEPKMTKAEIIDYLGAHKCEQIAAYELNEICI